MDLNIDDFFSEPKSSNIQGLIDEVNVPVYPSSMFLDYSVLERYDLVLSFDMPYDESEQPSYSYMNSFEMFRDYFGFYADEFIYGFIGNIIESHDKFDDGYTDFPTTKKREFGMCFNFGQKNKSRLLMQILLMFHQYGDYHQKSVSFGFNSLYMIQRDDSPSVLRTKDILRNLLENLDKLKKEATYWKFSDWFKELFDIESDRDVLQMHMTLRHFQERSRVPKFYKYDNRKKIVSVPSLYVQNDKDAFNAYKYREFMSHFISKDDSPFYWQYIDHMTLLRDK